MNKYLVLSFTEICLPSRDVVPPRDVVHSRDVIRARDVVHPEIASIQRCRTSRDVVHPEMLIERCDCEAPSMSGVEDLPDELFVVDVSVGILVRTDQKLHLFVREPLAW